jgi:uncharacterized membrane protein
MIEVLRRHFLVQQLQRNILELDVVSFSLGSFVAPQR